MEGCYRNIDTFVRSDEEGGEIFLETIGQCNNPDAWEKRVEKAASTLVPFSFFYVFVINNTRNIDRTRWYSKLDNQKDSI